LSGAPRSAGSVFRKIVAVVILIPLAIVIIAFAVANRQDVTVSLDPFGSNQSGSFTQPLFAVLVAVLIFGLIIGGVASWLRHGKWRRIARRLEREAAALRGEIDQLRRGAGAAPPSPPPAIEPPERLQLRAPVR
jgi:uncharacterized integral membrane protein